MPQHKLKVKAALPSSIAKKKKQQIHKTQKKNRPALPKKNQDGNSLRQEITKLINSTNETSAKERATVDGKTFRILPPVSVSTSTGTSSGASSKKAKPTRQVTS